MIKTCTGACQGGRVLASGMKCARGTQSERARAQPATMPQPEWEDLRTPSPHVHEQPDHHLQRQSFALTHQSLFGSVVGSRDDSTRRQNSHRRYHVEGAGLRGTVAWRAAGWGGLETYDLLGRYILSHLLLSHRRGLRPIRRRVPLRSSWPRVPFPLHSRSREVGPDSWSALSCAPANHRPRPAIQLLSRNVDAE